VLINGVDLADGDVLTADVCIVGAGPAGLTLATSLGSNGRRVLVLEAGGFDATADRQSLASGEVDSHHHASEALSLGRSIQFGGTANQWIHRTVPWDRRLRARLLPGRPIDFEHRPGIPDTGWPIDRAALDPFYERAMAICRLADRDWTPAAWASTVRAWEFAGGRLETAVCQYGPRDVFTHQFRDDVIGSDRTTLAIDVVATTLHRATTGGEVAALQAVTPRGARIEARAKVFVLASGGVENARLLLASQGTDGAGLGNEHDVVGRYLMDHPEFRVGVIAPRTPDAIASAGFYDIHWVEGAPVSGILVVSEDEMRRSDLLSVGGIVIPQPKGYGTDAERSMKELAGLARGELPAHWAQHVRRIASSPVDAARVMRARRFPPAERYSEFRGGWSRPGVSVRFSVMEVVIATEQAPRPENRITLGSGRDALGRPRARATWTWGSREQDSIRRIRGILAEDIRAAGLGELVPWVGLNGGARPVFGGLHHPMGTTRMHEDPRLGVVDPDCRVHGVPNLFVAGSSVFTTSVGHANPTLTLLALAVRLADHLRAVLD